MLNPKEWHSTARLISNAKNNTISLNVELTMRIISAALVEKVKQKAQLALIVEPVTLEPAKIAILAFPIKYTQE